MHLAQVNVARLLAPIDSPIEAEFAAALDPVNRLADDAPGFVWRLSADDPATVSSAGTEDELVVVNLSTWTDYAALHAFVYRTVHGGFVRRRSEWFEPVPGPAVALWWVPDGTRPTVAEAMARLDHLGAHGPTPQAFTMRRRFDPSGRPEVRAGATAE